MDAMHTTIFYPFLSLSMLGCYNMAASEASSEGVWIRNFITELGVVPSALDPLEILCNNTGAKALAKEPRYHPKTKHINRQFHII
jgi:hypothetical protein